MTHEAEIAEFRDHGVVSLPAHPDRLLGVEVRRTGMVLASMMAFVIASATLGAAATSASWVIQQTPNDGDHFGANHLYGVACVNVSRCVAVGVNA